MPRCLHTAQRAVCESGRSFQEMTVFRGPKTGARDALVFIHTHIEFCEPFNVPLELFDQGAKILKLKIEPRDGLFEEKPHIAFILKCRSYFLWAIC